MRYRQPMPNGTNIVVSQAAGDELRQRARDLSTVLGRRVTISEALTMALSATRGAGLAPGVAVRVTSRVKPDRPPTSESGVSASPDGRR